MNVHSVTSSSRRHRFRIAVATAWLGGVLPAWIATVAGGVEPYTIADPFAAHSLVWAAQDDSADDVTANDDADLFREPYTDGDDDDLSESEEDVVNDRMNRSIYGADGARVPEVQNGRFVLPPLMAPTTDTEDIGNGRLPEGYLQGEPAVIGGLPESLADRGYEAPWTPRPWEAPNTYSLPRYFEDRMLERHGHERFPLLTPMISGARFVATVPMLPYLMTVTSPCDCEYTLGYYRTGNCVPVMLQRPPYERRAALAEAAAIAGASVAFP